MQPRTLACVLAALLVLPGALPRISHAGEDAGENRSPAAYWTRSTPEEQGIDSVALAATLKKIRDENIPVHSVLLVRNGRMVLESYVHPYHRDDLHNVKSVSKSLISALVGIALREGVLKSLDQKVAEFFPAYFPEDGDPRKREITLRHLLTMTAGLDLDENGPKMGLVFRTPDWIRATFHNELVADPGTRFVYSTPLTHTMSGILTEASGISLREFADEHLLGPLGIDRLQWQQGPKGYYFGGAELWLTPDSMARFGQLFLDRGKLGERQIVPAEWVDESTRNQVEGVQGAGRYGYWWWIGDSGIYHAMGWGGQGIAVAPHLDTVLVITAADHGARDRTAREIFRGAIHDEGIPLEPDPEGVAELDRIVSELENPGPKPIPEHPEIAEKISGKTWRLSGDPRFRSMRFDFESDGRAFLTVERADGKGRMEIGLDGLYRLVETGEMGNMPEGNRFACRGRWTDGDTFAAEIHEMGNPLVSHVTVDFTEAKADLEIRVMPLGYRVSLTGTLPE